MTPSAVLIPTVVVALLVTGSAGGAAAVSAAAVPSVDKPVVMVDVRPGGRPAKAAATTPSLSADGRYVAFHSAAKRLVGDEYRRQSNQVFVRDAQTEVTVLVSRSRRGGASRGGGEYPSISADGTRVAFESYDSNLVRGDRNDESDVFITDIATGRAVLASRSDGGELGNSYSLDAALSGDGTRVAFYSQADNLVPGDTNGVSDVFLYDAASDHVELVSHGTGGTPGNADAVSPSISADGRYVAFGSYASNLVPGDTNGAQDVFRYDTVTGTTVLVTRDTAGGPANGASAKPSISADGSVVAYESYAADLVEDDPNGECDVFVTSIAGGSTTLVSHAADGEPGDAISTEATVSADGTRVGFVSLAQNLVDVPTDAFAVFRADVPTGEVVLMSANGRGDPADSGADLPAMSGDGMSVAFRSAARNLVRTDTNGQFHVYLTRRD